MEEAESQERPSFLHSSDIGREIDSISSIAKMLGSISSWPDALRREFRGEQMWEDEQGNIHWVQGTKPVFVKVDFKTGKPIKEAKLMPWGEEIEVYITNDDAIEEVISILKFAGINQISPVGFNQPDNYQDDLKEFECKLAGLLALKQKEWGLDKELLPMVQFKLKTIVQDIRSLSVKGNFITKLTASVQRVEQYIENDSNQKRGWNSNPF